jgi:hypothetical protein
LEVLLSGVAEDTVAEDCVESPCVVLLVMEPNDELSCDEVGAESPCVALLCAEVI